MTPVDIVCKALGGEVRILPTEMCTDKRRSYVAGIWSCHGDLALRVLSAPGARTEEEARANLDARLLDVAQGVVTMGKNKRNFVAFQESGRSEASLVEAGAVKAISPVKVARTDEPRCDLVFSSGARIQVVGDTAEIEALLDGAVLQTGIQFVGLDEGGKLKLKLDINGHSGMAYMSKEFWQELGRLAGWVE